VTDQWFDRLVDRLSHLPGIGRKTATRLAFTLVDDRELARELSDALRETWERVRECPRCRNLTEGDMCAVCADGSRAGTVCVVENPADLRSIEDAGLFRGRYFVLHGLLAPLDGVGPTQLGVDRLVSMISGTGSSEVILALDATADGEATCAFLARALDGSGARITRLARGLPSGASVEFADALTLAQAFEGRQKV
jgi:recombination protein RecR